jgi:hypothetical protein
LICRTKASAQPWQGEKRRTNNFMSNGRRSPWT